MRCHILLFIVLVALPACGGTLDPAPTSDADTDGNPEAAVDASVAETEPGLPWSCIIDGGALPCTGNDWAMIIPRDAGFGDLDAAITCGQTRCEPGWTCVDPAGASGVCE